MPLIHDILAAQRIYGADMTTRTGDTVYGFNSNAGRDTFDFIKTPAPIGAIWDAGGIDTIDTSGFATTQLIDLRAGSLSQHRRRHLRHRADASPRSTPTAPPRASRRSRATTYNANMAALARQPDRRPPDRQFRHRLWRRRSRMRSAARGNDTIIGNDVDNVLTGNAGNDALSRRRAATTR